MRIWTFPLLLCVLTGVSCEPTVAPERVDTITITPPLSPMAVGERITLKAVAYSSTKAILPNRPMRWDTKDPEIVSVGSTDGVVHALSPGRARVGVTSEGAITEVVIMVLGPPTRLELNPPSASLVRGESKTFTASVFDANGNPLPGAVVDWSTGDPEVVSIDAGGRATALKMGATQVVASAGGRRQTAQVTVTPARVATVDISPKEPSMVVGGSVAFQSVLKDIDGSVLTGRPVAWTTGDASIATITPQGIATAVKVGVTTVEVQAEDKRASTQLTVTAVPVDRLSISPAEVNLQVGGTVKLNAVAHDGQGNVLTGRPVEWRSGAPAVASIDASGVVMARAPGTATLTASVEGRLAEVRATVAALPVASVTVTPSTAFVDVGRTVRFEAVPRDAAGGLLTGRTTAWTSSNDAVATVDASGVATGKGVGQVTITATSEGKAGTAALSVALTPIATLAVVPGTTTMLAGDSLRVVAVAKDAEGNTLTGRAVTWSSNAPLVASVTLVGMVSAHATGAASITAASGGKEASARVTVENPVPVVNSVSPDTASAGSAGVTVTVRGARFVSGARVRWNGAERPTTFVSAAELRATLAAQDLAAAGTGQVTVENPVPGGGASGQVAFTVRPSGVVGLGAIVSGTLTVPGEVDEYTFLAASGQEVNVFFQATSGSWMDNLVLGVYDADGNLLDEVGSAGDAATLQRNATGRMRLARTGSYKVRVRAWDNTSDKGPYRFQVFAVDRRPETLGTGVAIGTIVDGEAISPAGDIDEFSFSGTSGAELNVFLQGTSGSWTDNFVLQVLDPSGSVMGETASAGDAEFLESSATGRLTLRVTGTYVVRIFGYNSTDDGGTYRFRLFGINRAPERISGAIMINALVAGEDISPKGDIDQFTFAAVAGKAVQIGFQVTSGSWMDDLSLALYSPSGARFGPITANGAGSIVYAPPVTLGETGNYTVMVYGYSNEDTGAFQFRVIPLN